MKQGTHLKKNGLPNTAGRNESKNISQSLRTRLESPLDWSKVDAKTVNTGREEQIITVTVNISKDAVSIGVIRARGMR